MLIYHGNEYFRVIKLFVQEGFKQCVVKSLNLGDRSQVVQSWTKLM